MRLSLQLATALLLTTTLAHAQIHSPQIQTKRDKKSREDIEWLWQYSPPPAEGRENDLIQDPHFKPFLAQYLTAPQTFWGPQTGKPKSLPEAAFDFLSVPGKVIADEDRYLTITGCVFKFCPNRGLLWVDLNSPHPLVLFAAIDWVQENRTPSDPAATYTLWLFTSRPVALEKSGAPGLASETWVSKPETLPKAFLKSFARWTSEPSNGSNTVQNITHAILVDPDGTPHEIAPSTIGILTPPAPSGTK